MRSPDVKDAPPPKKAKLEEISSDSEDEIYEKYLELPGQEYVVLVELEDIRKHRGSGGDMMILFRQIMRNAGCPEFKLSPQYNSLNFYAKLTPDEAERLSDLDSVHTVTPKIKWRVFHEFSQPSW